MNDRPQTHSNEGHHPEPEIIPPSRGKSRADAMWSSVDGRETHRIYVARLGPFAIAVLLFAMVVLAAVLLLLLVGTFLIWMPVILLIVAGALVSSYWRRTFRR